MAEVRSGRKGFKRRFEALAVGEDRESEMSGVEEGAVMAAVKRSRSGLAEVAIMGSVDSESSEDSAGATSTRSVASCESSTQSAGETSRAESSSPGKSEEHRLSRSVRQKLAQAGGNPARPVFTTEDVKEIAMHSMAERENKLHEEYARLLQERLAEQFQMFSQINRDFLYSAYREPEKTYVA